LFKSRQSSTNFTTSQAARSSTQNLDDLKQARPLPKRKLLSPSLIQRGQLHTLDQLDGERTPAMFASEQIVNSKLFRDKYPNCF
jgi:hypothetical protein